MAIRKILQSTRLLLVPPLLFCLVGWSETLGAGVEEISSSAEQSYSEGNYSTAKEIFSSLHRSYPNDSRSSYFQFMIAKCDYHLENYAFAEDKFKAFIESFPRSRFKPAAYFMLGNIAHLRGAPFQSARNFIQAHQLAQTGSLKHLAKKSIEPLLEKWLSIGELDKLSAEAKEKEVAASILFHLGKRNFEHENHAEAGKALNRYRDDFPDGDDIEDVYLLLQEISTSPTKMVKVGVLAPLTGELSVYGADLLNGINLALSSYPSPRRKVELKAQDTEGDFVRAASLCEKLIHKDSVVCIIGPLKSESVAAAAIVANHSQVPMITPTASKSGLAALGEFVFQLSPSSRSRGKRLAEVAVKEARLSDFIILSPQGEQVGSETSAFKETIQELGGEIAAEEHYAPGTQSFAPFLTSIKNKLLGVASTSLQEEEGSFFDQIPVWADGLFILADQSQMYDILSHVARLNIYATIIGTEGCASPQMLEFTQNIDREVIFTSDAFPQEDNPGWQHVSDLYYGRYNKDPDRVSLLGYDSMLLLLSILENVISPKNIKDALLRTDDFQGATGRVSFDPDGENTEVPIYRQESGMVRRVR
jgi:branched-chain amino acid transport system substrate-binding protein